MLFNHVHIHCSFLKDRGPIFLGHLRIGGTRWRSGKVQWTRSEQLTGEESVGPTVKISDVGRTIISRLTIDA